MTDPPSLPEHGYVRLKTVLALIPVSKSSFYQGIKDGRFPAPVRILPNVSAWKSEVIKALLERLAEADPQYRLRPENYGPSATTETEFSGNPEKSGSSTSARNPHA